MIGKLIGPVLLSLDDHGRGIAIVDGRSLRVEWGGKSERLNVGGPERRRITLEMNVIDVLDEQQQRQKIERLEQQLAQERERLDDMQRVFEGRAYAAGVDD